MSLIDQAMQLDAVLTLGGGGEVPGKESFTFTPKAGTPRTVYGVIDRSPPERMGADGMVSKPRATIVVANDSTNGIALSEVTSGATVSFALRIGVASSVPTSPMPVSLAEDPGNQDVGALVLQV